MSRFLNLAHEAVEAAEAAAETALEEVEAEAEELVQEAEAEVCGKEEHAFQNIQRSLTAPKSKKEVTPGHCIVDSTLFNGTVIAMTVMNTIQMGFEADYPDWTTTWLICENIFTAGFFIEMLIKLSTYKCAYFKDAANWLDGCLTSLGVLDCWILTALGSEGGVDLQSLSVLRVLRLLRLARILKLMRSVRPLLLVIRGVMKSMSTAGYVFALCISIFYVFAIFLTEHLGKDNLDKYPGFSKMEDVIDEQEFMLNYNPHVCFGSMVSSMLTLFNMAIFSEWAEIIRPIAYKQPIFVPMFLLFATCVGFGVMNVLIGVIVDVVTVESRKIENDYRAQLKKDKLKTLSKIQTLLTDIDKDSNGVIELRELREAMEVNRQLQELMATIDLPQGWTAEELLDMLDNNSDGCLQYGEFATSFFRLMDSDDFQQICIMQASINQVKLLAKDNNKLIVQKQSVIEADLAAIKGALGIVADSSTQPALNQLTVHCAASAITPSCSEPCGKLGELHSVAAHDQFVDRVQMMSKALLGSTSDAPGKTPAGSDSVLSTQLKEVFDAALMVVEECIRKEFTSFTPSFESELRCLRPEKNGCSGRHCGSLSEADDKSTVPAAVPSSGPTELTVGNRIASFNLADGERQGELAIDTETSVPECRVKGFTFGNDELPEPSANNFSVTVECLQHSKVLASEFDSCTKPAAYSYIDEGCGHLAANDELPEPSASNFPVTVECLQHSEVLASELHGSINPAVHSYVDEACGHLAAAQPDRCSGYYAYSMHDDWLEGQAQEDLLLAAIHPVHSQCMMQDFLFEDVTQRLGFDVHWVKDGFPLVGNVVPGGAASMQGALEGDRLAECNGMSTAGRDRAEVLKALATRPLRLRMLRA